MVVVLPTTTNIVKQQCISEWHVFNFCKIVRHCDAYCHRVDAENEML